MKLTPVECLPRRCQDACRHKDRLKILDDFLESGALVARVDLEKGDYCTTRDCATSLRDAIHTYEYPINVAMRNGDVYLVKK